MAIEQTDNKENYHTLRPKKQLLADLQRACLDIMVRTEADTINIACNKLLAKAGISSSTFYDNFDDLDELIVQSKQFILEEMGALFNTPDSQMTEKQILWNLFWRIGRRREVMELAIRRFGNEFWREVACVDPRLIVNRWSRFPSPIPDYLYGAYAAYFQYVLQQWMAKDFDMKRANQYIALLINFRGFLDTQSALAQRNGVQKDAQNG